MSIITTKILIAEVELQAVSNELINFITTNREPAFRDRSEVLKEHLYDVDELMKEDSDEIPNAIKDELDNLQTLLVDSKISYVKFVIN